MKVPHLSLRGFALLAVFWLSLFTEAAAAPRMDSMPARVVAVNDGDTLSVVIGRQKERVRLAGIDSPELAQRPWGAYAKRYLRELISSSENSVILEFDVERRDRYRRLLAYAWTLDGKLINLEMIRNGCALLYTVSPNVRYAEVFREAQRFAREKGLGIWAGNGLREMPRSYRKGHPREPNPLSGFSP